MSTLPNIVVIVSGFAIVALASRQIGDFFARIHLPLISGFLFAGILVGPFVLNLIPADSVASLHFVDETALGYIAFAAGSELHIKELRGRLKSIGWVTLGNTLIVPLVGSLALFLLADYLPFMQSMSVGERTAVALLAGAILLARSPSSVIAIVNELRAKGPYTQTIVGVTMVIDVIVIVVFAINLEIADAIMTHLSFNVGFMVLLLFELLLSLAIGLLAGKILQFILSRHTNHLLKSGFILLTGYGVFVLSTAVRLYSHQFLPFELLLEPLLICMNGSFYVTNFTHYRVESIKRLH
ncbi:MAG: cation:proton antiporter, partial [Anaerolineae bacterium]